MRFVWPDRHGVYLLPSGVCPTVFAPGQAELAPVSPSGSYTTHALAAGTYWYACQVCDFISMWAEQRFIPNLARSPCRMALTYHIPREALGHQPRWLPLHNSKDPMQAREEQIALSEVGRCIDCVM